MPLLVLTIYFHILGLSLLPFDYTSKTYNHLKADAIFGFQRVYVLSLISETETSAIIKSIMTIDVTSILVWPNTTTSGIAQDFQTQKSLKLCVAY